MFFVSINYYYYYEDYIATLGNYVKERKQVKRQTPRRKKQEDR